MINVQEKKGKIISFLQNNGPSLPVRIARAIEMDPMFATAIASELLASKKIITSNMKVGSSFLYLLPGQERQLENFLENLKSIERDLVDLLKENKVLTDEELEPATRVAIRGIKDFAKPFKFKDKIMWKYAFISDEEIKSIINKPKEEIEEELIETRKTQEKQEEFQEVKKELEKIAEDESVPKAWEVKKEEITKKKEETSSLKEETKLENIFSKNEEIEEPEFLREIKKFLERKNISFLEEIRTEKKEIMARVKISSQLGEINMLLIAKDKKTTNKDEIRASIQMATNVDMPCLLIIRKEPTKSIEKITENNFLIKILAME